MSKNEKKKREKITYIDDGRTIADMSFTKKGKASSSVKDADKKPVSTWREKWRTYFDSVKIMILPMLITLLLIGAAFGLLWLLLTLAM